MDFNDTISRSAQFGGLEFPNRTDYETYFFNHGLIATSEVLWSKEGFVGLIHRHWHGEGQNGCIFALLSARRAEELGWQQFVVTDKISTIDSKVLRRIEAFIRKAITNRNCEVVSLLFSNVTEPQELVDLIRILLTSDLINLESEDEINEVVTLAIRVPLENNSVQSWAMAFGPFDFFPQTRKGPITELAIRVKTKPEKQFHRLSKDSDAAHLADLPVDYPDKIMERIWNNTLKRTRLILGEEPNIHSAAKTTFNIPRHLWRSR